MNQPLKTEPALIFLFLLLKFFAVFQLMYYLDLLPAENHIPVMKTHDGETYLKAAKNIVCYGTYTLSDLPSDSPAFYAGRMAGYELFMALFIILFKDDDILLVIVIVQIFISILSAFALGRIAKVVFKRPLIYYCTLTLYLLNTYVTVFDISILSESLAVSLVIFSIYFLTKERSTSLNYFFSGLTLTIAFFLRPYLLVLLPIYLYFIVITTDCLLVKSKIRWKNLFNFMISFILLEAIWITRNYNATDKFIPLINDVHAQIEYPLSYRSLFSFVQSWGGDIVWWNSKAEINAFINTNNLPHIKAHYNSIHDLPKYIYTSKYNIDSLVIIKHLLEIEAESNVYTLERKVASDRVSNMLNRYTTSFKSEKPFHYYVYAPLRLIPKFIFHSGTYNISAKSFEEMNWVGRIYKFFYSILYLFTLIFGTISLIYCIFYLKTPHIIMLAYTALIMIIICPLLFRRIEYRYFVLSYPFLTIFAGYFIQRVNDVLIRK